MTDQIEFNVWNKWDPLKTCIIGSSVNPDYFEHVKNAEIKDKLTKMLMNHSPKECADLLFDFFERHTDLRRADITLAEFMTAYDKDKLQNK